MNQNPHGIQHQLSQDGMEPAPLRVYQRPDRGLFVYISFFWPYFSSCKWSFVPILVFCLLICKVISKHLFISSHEVLRQMEGGFIWGLVLYIRSTVWMKVEVYGPGERWRAMMHTVKLLFVVFSCLCVVAWASSNRQPCRKRLFHSLSHVSVIFLFF